LLLPQHKQILTSIVPYDAYQTDHLHGSTSLYLPNEMSTPEKTTIPKVQRAWRVVRQGHPSKALKYVNDAPVRTDLADGEVLVKVGAAALNPVYVLRHHLYAHDTEF
jgi:hypothetical protein